MSSSSDVLCPSSLELEDPLPPLPFPLPSEGRNDGAEEGLLDGLRVGGDVGSGVGRGSVRKSGTGAVFSRSWKVNA